jgi:glutamyl/glutaminyl-tRNA synthetase
MNVTEFALIRLRDGYDELELLETLMQCQELQDEWMNQNQPHTLQRAHTGNLSSMYIQRDPDYLLITALWESPEAHREWIKSKDNQMGFARLSTFIAPGCSSVLLFHVDTAGEPVQLRGEFLAREEFHVYRLVNKSDKKDLVGQMYHDLEKQVHEKSPEQLLWGGWRIEKNSDAEEELVVFRCKDVPDEHMDGLLKLADEMETYNFRHVVP